MRDGCKLSFRRPLAASPLARAFSRGSLRSPKQESLPAGYDQVRLALRVSYTRVMVQVILDFGRYVCYSDDENFNLPFSPSDLDIGNYVIAGYP